jgi:hypothetical protein
LATFFQPGCQCICAWFTHIFNLDSFITKGGPTISE